MVRAVAEITVEHSFGGGDGGGGGAEGCVHAKQPSHSDQPHFLSQPFVLVAQEGLQFANEAQAPHLAHFDQAHLTVQSWPSSRQNLRQSSPAAEASAMASTQYLISGERQVRAECRTITCVVW